MAGLTLSRNGANLLLFAITAVQEMRGNLAVESCHFIIGKQDSGVSNFCVACSPCHSARVYGHGTTSMPYVVRSYSVLFLKYGQ